MGYDLVIIGGGIVGLSTAFQIQNRFPHLHIAVVEKETSIATHQTDRNSGVIHSGIYYKPGSAKAINCVKGYSMLLTFCKEYGVEYDLCGKVIVATYEKEIPVLQSIYQRGIQNGLTGLEMWKKEKVLEREPYCHAVEAIWVPQAGIIDFRKVAERIADLFRERGGELITGFAVNHVETIQGRVIIHSNNRMVETSFAISCAGLYSDKVAKMAGVIPPHQIVPFRGEFYDLTPAAASKVNGLIYPVPDINFPFLGVHLTKRIHGGVEAGPNAVLAFRREGYQHLDIHRKELSEILAFSGFRKMAFKYWKKGMGEMHRSFSKKAFLKSLQKLMPSLTADDILRGRTGVRAQALDPTGRMEDDYVVIEQDRMIHLLNAPSPAATSSLSIGETMADRFALKYNSLI